MKAKKQKRALTTHQVADYCGCHFTSVIRWISQGKLKAYRTLGGHRRILVDDLRQFMKTYGIPEPPELSQEANPGPMDKVAGRDGRSSEARSKRKVST